MNNLDEEMILRILDDNYDENGQLIYKVEEPKKNSLPSSPKDDIIEIDTFSQEIVDQPKEFQIQIQSTIKIQNDKPNNSQNDEPNNSQNQETNNSQNQGANNSQNQGANNSQNQAKSAKDFDPLNDLFSNPHEDHDNEMDNEDEEIISEIVGNDTSNHEKSNEQEETENQQEETEQSNSADNRAKLIAERLRQKAKLSKPQKQLSLSFDLSNDSSDSVGLRVVVPQKKKRQLFREKMLEEHSKIIKEDINEAPNQEIQEEEYDVEEEEEEEKNEEKKDEQTEELKNNDIAKAVIEELKNEEDENLTDEELEHRLYEKMKEFRLTEDLEEIKKIIRIITGQWRSGKLRFGDLAEGLEKAFEGNEQERKDLENKRMMRKQRKQKKSEEKTRKLTQENISQLIERAMWIKAGQDENASASDIIRGERAKLSDNDPRVAIMERLEMDAFLQEERAKNALKERRISKKQMQKVERTSSGSRENSFSKITFKSSQISHQHLFSFNLSKDKPISKEKDPSPKKPERKKQKVDKKFAEFLSKINK